MTRYHENKAAGLPVPSILGLTASPIIRSKTDSLEEIERTLDAVCKTPTLHRDQLVSTVKRPKMYRVFYSRPDYIPPTSNMNSLSSAYYNLNIYEDPTIIRLQREDSERSRVALHKALQSRDTYVLNQLQTLWRKSTAIQRELGSVSHPFQIIMVLLALCIRQGIMGSRDESPGWDLYSVYSVYKPIITNTYT